MVKAATGVSSGNDTYSTAVEAATKAISNLGADATLVIVFASVKYDQELLLKGVQSVVSESAQILGSSTAGEITETGPIGRHSVSVMALHTEDVQFFSAHGAPVSAGAFESGKTMATALQEEAGANELKLLIMFPDVLNGNGADIVRGAQHVLGEHFPIVGGASGDDFQFKKVFQYYRGEVLNDTVVGIGLSGNVEFGIGVKHGWVPIGVPMKATKSKGSVLHEVDNKPAVSVYEDYFGEEIAKEIKEETLAKLAITYPLGMKVEGSDEMLVRDPISVDEHGSITCAAEIPEGSEIRLMVGSREDAVAVAREAGKKVVDDLGGNNPSAILIFNCIARSKLFGERKGDEIKAIQEHVGQDTPLLGFYTYGEQAPLAGETRNIEKCNPSFHNETVVILGLK